jgi:hypothetical protein
MKLKNLTLLVILTVLLSSCSNNHKLRDAKEVIAEMSNDEVSTSNDVNSEENALVQENSAIDKTKNEDNTNKKKIIKDGRISIETKDITSSKKSIDEIVKKFNSYYDTEELHNNETTTYFDLKLRIPADNFEKLIKALENGKDEIISKSIHSRDVTEEFVDIEARLNYKRDFLKRYKDLLLKASSVKDILDVEENIRKLQEEIESKEGRLKYLKDQVNYSTLEIELSQEKGYVYRPKQLDKFTERFKNSISQGWAALVSFVLWGISLWPFIIILFSIYLIWRRIIRQRKNRKLIDNSKNEK